MEQGMGRPGWVLGGRYRVGNQLGHGGYGRVWEAYDEVLSRRVAVKAVGPTDPGAVLAERFAREVARLDHPNLVTVYELVEADGVVWSVMPFVSGPSLAEYLAENGRMSGERVREVAKALLDALAALHEAGVVHGDVRPANVLMAEGDGCCCRASTPWRGTTTPTPSSTTGGSSPPRTTSPLSGCTAPPGAEQRPVLPGGDTPRARHGTSAVPAG